MAEFQDLCCPFVDSYLWSQTRLFLTKDILVISDFCALRKFPSVSFHSSKYTGLPGFFLIPLPNPWNSSHPRLYYKLASTVTFRPPMRSNCSYSPIMDFICFPRLFSKIWQWYYWVTRLQSYWQQIWFYISQYRSTRIESEMNV